VRERWGRQAMEIWNVAVLTGLAALANPHLPFRAAQCATRWGTQHAARWVSLEFGAQEPA
jgi:hypothetical protein